MLFLLPLLLIGVIYWYVSSRYAIIGKNVGHQNPSMAYFFFVPLVFPIYIMQMAKFSRNKIFAFVGLWLFLFAFPFFIISQQITSSQTKAQASLELLKMANEDTQRKTAAALSVEASPDIPDYKESERYKELQRKVEGDGGMPPVLAGLANTALLILSFYFLFLVTKVVQASWVNIFWNFLPLIGPFLFIHFMVKSSENVTPTEDGEVDVQGVFDSLAANEKQVMLQIVEALKSPASPTESQILSQLANMGFDQEKSELITALASEIRKAQA